MPHPKPRYGHDLSIMLQVGQLKPFPLLLYYPRNKLFRARQKRPELLHHRKATSDRFWFYRYLDRHSPSQRIVCCSYHPCRARRCIICAT